ncbi:MAG: NAD-glutamate dehydrogenase [Rhodovarius sp.]|nr:NAD-glutamate dehydrogenase [Rhodovarius sp.]
MPDAGAAAPDPLREEALRLAQAALPPGLPQAAVLLAALAAPLSGRELAALAPERLAAMAVSLLGTLRQRLPGQARIRLLPPGRFPEPVVEIATDDMPFLVDSVLATLQRLGRHPRQVLHPILKARRDPEGRLLALGEGELTESVMRIALAGPVPDAAALEAAVAATLADVRRAVEDFPAMLALLREQAARLEGEDRAFLEWLAAENFVLTGHRRLVALPDGGLRAEAELGVLRGGPPVFDALAALSQVPAAVREALLNGPPVTVAKANLRSTVHRPQHADVVAVRPPRAEGEAPAVSLFLGLFAAAAYNRNPRSIPKLASKVERILAAAGVSPETHDGRALRHILDTWPRDELFQASEEEILAAARRALALTLTPRPALVLRRDPFGRFVSAIVWVPREGFDTRLRQKLGEILARAHGGRLSTFYLAIGDQPLARVHYIIGTDPAQPVHPDPEALEALIAEAARAFPEKLAAALASAHGEAEAARLMARWGDAFPAAWREAENPTQAVADLALAEAALAQGRAAAAFETPPDAPPGRLALRLAHPGGPLPLASALPLFESLGLKAVEETPYRLQPADTAPVVLHVFQLEAAQPVPEGRFAALREALSALLEGRAEADGFNRLVLAAGLSWRECWLLRAIFRWLKQVGFPFAQGAVEEALAAEPEVAALLIALFRARFDPAASTQPEEEAALSRRLDAALERIADPDAERILSRLRQVMDAILRTDFFLDRPAIAFKLDCAAAGEMPSPRPWREIFVHAPGMEGCHLRAGPVARGGIRWSDRREDFRTEILGLMKAQVVKNAIIVPTGAKGGFVLKGPLPADRAALQQAGIAAYRLLIGAMLTLTDNLVDGRAVPAAGVRRRDGDDPYIVAAADKGTATFSDIANAMAEEAGFWLGDAFASGGSAGYDHKRMGITARGAWVMIARHFAERGQDIQAEPFTCVGVGDMSGDVFGNGLLVTRQVRLLAAFDHRHIFLDPDPDPAASYEERARLFALPRSSWADYDPARISKGGGVYPRQVRQLTLSPEAQAMLGLPSPRASPAEVIRAILTMPVDLLYFGGIGTFVKASHESHAAVGDRANDALRVDGRALRARVVGEGANLAFTQAGRIEAALSGVALNTDALDNAAGVATSDREVNIKILLAAAERAGRITRPQRNALLSAMTEEVAALVLAENRAQSLAVSLEVAAGAAAWPAAGALMARLEAAGLLDRRLACLPDEAAIASRAAAGPAITRPEAAALLPLAKLWLTDGLLASDLPGQEVFLPLLLAYFPTPLREAHADLIARHPLRRELLATLLANRIANLLGPAALGRLSAEATPAALARAAWLAAEGLGLAAAMDAADAEAAPWPDRCARLLALRADLERAAAHLLADPAPVEEALRRLREGAGVMALLSARGDAPAVLRLAADTGASPAAAAAAWEEVARHFHLPALRAAAEAAPAPGPFGQRARAGLLAGLDRVQGRLAAARLSGAAVGPAAEEVARLCAEAARLPELSAGMVALAALDRLA